MAIVSILATCLPWRICRFCASTYTTHIPPMLGSTPFGEASAPSLAQCHVGDECLSQLGQSMGLNIWSSLTWQLRRSRLTVLSCTKSCRVQCLCTVLTNGDSQPPSFWLHYREMCAFLWVYFAQQANATEANTSYHMDKRKKKGRKLVFVN